MKTEIKAGDKVQCIDARYTFNKLVEGVFYTVVKIDGGLYVQIPGAGPYPLSRFEGGEA